MRYVCILTLLLLSTPLASLAQKREIMEMQRDIAALQDQVKTIQRTLDEKVGSLTTLLQQVLENTNKANIGMGVFQNDVGQRLREQEKTVVGPVAGLGAKIDNLAEEVRTVKETVAVIGSRMDKLGTQISDVERAVKTMQAPPAPPSTSSSPGGASSGPSGPPPGMTATSVYQAASRDLSAGNYDMALQEFTDYLRYFGNTDLAPNAQFYIGMVYYNKGEMEPAVKAFDQVLEQYSENNKTVDAMYMKGKALLKLGRRTAAAEEFRNVVRKYPSSDQAGKSKTELRALGYSIPGTTTKKRAR